MSQMDHHARVVTSSDLRRRSGQNFIKSFAIRTEPEKWFFAARAYRAKSSFGSDDGLRCVITTVLTPACAASLPTSSGVTCSSCMWRNQPSCSDSDLACQAPLRFISPITSSVSVTSVTKTSAPFARSMTVSDQPVSPVNRNERPSVSKRYENDLYLP